MTIGVGFHCSDAVVLASDRQITSPGGYKYHEKKLFWSQKNENWTLIFNYAGSPDAAQVMFRRVREALEDRLEETAGTFPHDRARKILEEVFFDNVTDGLQTLMGFWSLHGPPYLFKTQDTKVVDGHVEYIGCGDSSALRYIASFLHPRDHSIEEAQALATYFVSVANRYVDGCSGGPDISILRSDGTMQDIDHGIQSNNDTYFLAYEEQMGRLLSEFLKGERKLGG